VQYWIVVEVVVEDDEVVVIVVVVEAHFAYPVEQPEVTRSGHEEGHAQLVYWLLVIHTLQLQAGLVVVDVVEVVVEVVVVVVDIHFASLVPQPVVVP